MTGRDGSEGKGVAADQFSGLETLVASADTHQRQIAAKTGLNLAKVNFVVRHLVERGLVRLKRVRDNPHKLRYLYLLTPEGVQRVRNMEDGDEIDLNAAIDAMVAIRMGEQPNPRITMRNLIKSRDLAVVVLLDLSESTNETVAGSDKTVLQLTREAASLVSTAIDGIGDPFAVHGFASDGRHGTTCR